MPLGLIGIVLFALVVLFILFFPRSNKEVGDSYLAEVEQRLLILEERIAKPSNSEGAPAGAVYENQIQKLKQRIDLLEGSQSLRMRQLEKELQQIKKTGVARSGTRKKAAEPITPKATAKIHIVEKGDTVYSIGLKYGLKPGEVRRLNKLGKEAKIFPGQRLNVAK